MSKLNYELMSRTRQDPGSLHPLRSGLSNSAVSRHWDLAPGTFYGQDIPVDLALALCFFYKFYH